MNRRRMMIENRIFTVTLDFTNSADDGAYVEYCGTKYTEGSIKCKKGEIIVCGISGTKRNGKILLNGEEVSISASEPFCKIAVESNITVAVRDVEMYIVTT